MPVRTIYIDVDRTLCDLNGDVYPGVEAVLKVFKRMYTVIAWSHTGGAYALEACKKNGINKYFDHFLDKPDILIDDSPDSIMRLPLVLKVEDGKTWWAEAIDRIFNSHVREEKQLELFPQEKIPVREGKRSLK